MAYGQDNLQGWEARQRGLVDTALSRYLSEFTQGGAYAPERLLALFNENYGQDIPQVQAVNAQAGLPYARQAMGLASRAAAIQAGNAAQGLSGLNPAAQVAGLSQIARGASANVGNIGAQAYGQGLGLVQQANLSNQDVLMRNRLAAMGLFEGGVNRAYNSGMFGANSLVDGIRDYWQRRGRAQQEKDAATGQAIGSIVGHGVSALAGSQGAPQAQSQGRPYYAPYET